MSNNRSVASNAWPLVSVVLLNWNGYEDTLFCLRSLEQATYPNMHVVVVDNGSRDGSPERLRSLLARCPNVALLENASNLGFARGCNVGLQWALQEGCDYVLLLNNDSVVDASFLEPAVSMAERDASIGLIGGKIYLEKDRKLLWYAGGHVDLWRGQAIVRGFKTPDEGQFDTAVEVGFVTGALMLIKRSVLLKVGVLPAEYFFGQEEWDYSLQVKRAGYKLYYVPEFVAVHMGDGSHSNADPKYVYNSYRNKLIFQQKFLPRTIWPIWLLAMRIYAKSTARRQLRVTHGEQAEMADLLFALEAAIADHRKYGIRPIVEQDLEEFEATLLQRKKSIRTAS